MSEPIDVPEVQTPADPDEPFDVQAARHTASAETLRVLHRRNLVDADDLAPIHETISLLRDALAPAFIAEDREMFEHAVASFPR
jgi:hypothetical protein